MLTRHPEKFGALFCTIPLIDMRRYSKLLAGASWIEEYGDPDKPEDWAFLQHISAYHLAAPGRPYPPILIATSRRDDRVHPGHARKFAAKLQALGYRAHFYEPAAGGHGYGKDNAERAGFVALGLDFLWTALAGASPDRNTGSGAPAPLAAETSLMTAEAVPLAQDARVRPRRVWLALGIALLSPAAGYLYVGRPRRALAMALFSLATAMALRNGLGGLMAQPAPLLALIVVELGVRLFALIDAARIARGERAYRLRRYNSAFAYLGAGLAVALGFSALVNPAMGGFLAARSYTIPSGSMIPTLLVGDYAVGDMRAYERAAPAPGDIVLIARNATTYVKRVIAGPGDTVALLHGVVYVNDAPARLDPVGLDDPAPRAIETLTNGTSHVIMLGAAETNEMAKVTVPAGAYFVLGDNRGNSMDSRLAAFGFVPRAEIVGRMSFVYWSSDRRHIGATLP